MGFRTVEITRPSEIHLKRNQFTVQQEDRYAEIPVEDIDTIIFTGANIRVSTSTLSRLAREGISLMTVDEKYNPACITTPLEGNARQASVRQNQIDMTDELKNYLWQDIISSKIRNQGTALNITGRDGSELLEIASTISGDNIDYIEAYAAGVYFRAYMPDETRREDSPLNSRLNYGYAVIRNNIIRTIAAAGFEPSFGINHSSQMNPFNLADDLIEPWRPFVDLLSFQMEGRNEILDKEERRRLAMVTRHACIMDNRRVSVKDGIDMMVSSFRRAVMGEGSKLMLPELTEIEVIEAVTL